MKITYPILGIGLLSFSLSVNAQNLKSTIRAQTYPYGQVSDKLIREYNKNEKLISQVTKDFRGIATRSSYYIVDDKGRMISDSTYNSDNALIEASSFEYNDHDDIIFQKRLLIEQGAYYEEIYDRKYDSHGNQIEFKQFNKEGELAWLYKYKFDVHGNELKQFRFFKGTLREEFSKKYKNDHCISDKLYAYSKDKSKRNLAGFWIYEYDDQGRKLKMTDYDIVENKVQKINEVHEYKYDEEGHMTEEKIRGEDGRVFFIIKIVNTYW